MCLFDHFKKRKPTSDQLERLSRITNRQQREALLKAIERGEPIPAYAWDPLPADLDTVALYRRFQEYVRSSPTRVKEATAGAQAAVPWTQPSTGELGPDVGPDIINFLFATMGIDEAWSLREPRSFTWWGHGLAQRVWADPARHSDGYPVVRLGAETDLLHHVPSTREVAEKLALLNHHASMSAFVWDPTCASISLRCVVYVHPETAGWVKSLFATACALQAADAHIKVDGLAKVLGGDPAVSAHPTSGPRPEMDNMLSVIEQLFAPSGTGPVPCSEGDFSAAAHSQALPWVMSEAKGLTLSGVVYSHDRPSGTGLLTMSGSSRHPQLGSGLLSVLRIPADYEPDMSLAMCHELNLLEATTATARAYFLGAWCPQPKPQQGLAFASFIPTAACRPGHIDAVAMSMAARAAWATSLLDAASTNMKAEGEGPTTATTDQNILGRSIGRVLEWRVDDARGRIRRHLGSAANAPEAGTQGHPPGNGRVGNN